MTLLIIYIIASYFLAPALGGILDRFFDTDYPADDIVFIILSPVLIPVIILLFICGIIGRIVKNWTILK